MNQLIMDSKYEAIITIKEEVEKEREEREKLF
jgi:hypothetical protein